MAKNLKLHIKNPQLADAIDLQGLKAKLSKKKDVSSSMEEEESPAKKPKKGKREPLVPEPSSIPPETRQEIFLEDSEEKKNKPAVQDGVVSEEKELVKEEPFFPTLYAEEREREAKREDDVHENMTHAEQASMVSRHEISETLVVEQKKIEEEKKQPVLPVKRAEEQKPFLSALRTNPENLGPVLSQKSSDDRAFKKKGLAADQRKPQREPEQKLWEPLKTSPGSRYHPFSDHGKPGVARGGPAPSTRGERADQSFSEARERPPMREGMSDKERRPFERPTGARPYDRPAGARSFERPAGARPFDRPAGARPYDRPAGARPFDRPAGVRPFAKEHPAQLKKEPMQEAPPVLSEEELLERRRKLTKETKEREKEKESRFHKKSETKPFDDTRLRRGIAIEKEEEGEIWRKRRGLKSKAALGSQEIEIIRPKEITIRLPISVKDLAQTMKLKSSQLISKLFLSGVVVTLNDILDDETTVQVLGDEFGCMIRIDTVEAERLRITDRSIQEEIQETPVDALSQRSPIVAFMGHVDHGKTSIIDKIRKSNRAQNEVGAITQHIGAFVCPTAHGPLTVLDTPGHEAFFQMRARGAHVTDIVVLVVAGDEGIKEQTLEALSQARESHSTIVVAINKCDKPTYDEGMVFRQLAENNLLPEAWGGQTVTVKCSALTGEGIDALLEMLALQAEVLELKANPSARARGSIIETEMHKGLGAVATLLVQNGTLHLGDALVFESSFAKVKSMRDEWGRDVQEAGPSSAVRIHGLSSLPSAGEEFIVVPSERDAREIAEGRLEGKRQSTFQGKRRKTLESMMEQASQKKKKELNVIVRADVQGSLEALCHALSKISSDKIDLNILGTGIGEISESDVQLGMASKAVILGYHTQVEAHAEQMIKEGGVQVRLHSIIYHAVDDVKELMKSALDKIREEVQKGKAEVKALFKSSQLGNISGCLVIDGTISRNSHIRVRRGEESIFEGTIASLKRFKEDVREVSKGTECGIVLNNWNEAAPGDIFEAFDISYRAQEL